MARRKAQKQQARGTQLRLGSPPPVQGRRHERVQTDNYLEAIYNDPPCEDTCTQTDLFLDRPVSPLYVPAKTGADVETQIYPGEVRLCYLLLLIRIITIRLNFVFINVFSRLIFCKELVIIYNGY